jgi:TonB-dependent receptor
MVAGGQPAFGAPAADDPVNEAAGADFAQVPETGPPIVVTGIRIVQRESLQIKRDSAVIVDALAAEETGSLVDNSIADILERVTGATADRFKGNANEVSLRGLGPTLTLATLNGQEISTAGPDRSVAFQQFPSELVQGVVISKSQRSDFIEGGIAGIIDLRTVRPLDTNRTEVRAAMRTSYSPQDDRITGRDGMGYRLSVSAVNKWTSGLGDIGVSIGLQHSSQKAPEDYYTTSAAFTPCTSVASEPASLSARGSVLNCALISTPRNPNESVGSTYFGTATRGYRILLTKEERDSALGTLQWRPSPELEITLDSQYSKRKSGEKRRTLVVTEALRGISPDLIGDGRNGYDAGVLMRYSGNSNLESQLEDRQRDEEYVGGSAEIGWTGDRLVLGLAASYSGSHRTEQQKATRLRSDQRVAYRFDGTSDAVPSIQFTAFDINDPARFSSLVPSSAFARRRFVTDRRDTIRAIRFDADYRLDGPVLRRIRAGIRYSDHDRTNDNAANNDLNTIVARDGLSAAQLIQQGNSGCRTPFPASGFMRTSDTNIHSWAVFDNDCLFRTFTGSDNALPRPADTRDSSDIDVRERTAAAYLGFDYAAPIGQTLISGDFGVRYVRTKVVSSGFRSPVTVTINSAANEYVVAPDPSGAVTSTRRTGKYGYWLPSANARLELSDRLQVRLAAYRAMARSGIELFGAGIDFTPMSGTGVNTIMFNASGGNPALRPTLSWNLDASLEYYLDRDTAFSVAPYSKWLQGAVINAVTAVPMTIEAITIADGGAPIKQVFPVALVAPANDRRTRHVYGVEVQASHVFKELPKPFDGLGLRAGYNLALSNFEYPDTSALAPFLDPANLIGLSRHSAHGTLYWERPGFSVNASYQYRSSYFKPNSSTNRSVRGSGHLSVSMQYDLSPALQIRAQALNLTGTRDIFYKGVSDNVTEVSETGPTYFLAFRYRL